MEQSDLGQGIKSTKWDGRIRTLYPVNCLTCGVEFHAPANQIRKGNAKFCSKECRGLDFRNRVACKCAMCGVAFDRTVSKVSLSKSGLQFCSRECKDRAQRLKSGMTEIHPPHYGSLAEHKERYYRRFALESKEHRCERCGYNKIPGILEVHHKDRNRAHNEIENLEVICPNCHQEEHFLTQTGRYTRGA